MTLQRTSTDITTITLDSIHHVDDDVVPDLARDFRIKTIKQTLDVIGISNYLGLYEGVAVDQLATHFDVKPDLLERILNAGCFLEILEKREEKFFLSTFDMNRPPFVSERLFELNQYGLTNGFDFDRPINEISFSDTELTILISSEILELKHGDIFFSARQGFNFDSSNSRNNIFRLLYYENILSKLYSAENVVETLKNGSNAWKKFDTHAKDDPFHFYGDKPELLIDLLKTLHYSNDNSNYLLLEAFKNIAPELSSLLDIGGSCGNFALNADKHYAFDKVHIYEKDDGKKTITTVLEDLQITLPDCLEYKWGNFLSPDVNFLPGIESEKYDLVAMGFILHDWNDETGIQLLKKAAHHLNDDGYLMLMEWVLNEEKNNSITLQDIDMLLETQGRERTLREFSNILHPAGLAIKIVITSPGHRSLIAAKKII